VTAIKKDFEVLSSGSASQAQKLASLKFLGHWAGDIHQPLRVSFEDDRGGNSVLVTGLCGANLHLGYVPCAQGSRRGRGRSRYRVVENDHAGQNRELDPFGADGLGKRVLRHRWTGTDEILRSTGRVLRSAIWESHIDAAYVAVNAPVIREQLQKAGVRLAHLLDAALGK
jgi:hypothetical protein